MTWPLPGFKPAEYDWKQYTRQQTKNYQLLLYKIAFGKAKERSEWLAQV
jgi:hypothetical protein